MSRRHSTSVPSLAPLAGSPSRNNRKQIMRPVALAIQAMLIVGAAGFAAQAQAQSPGDAARAPTGMRSYDIPAGPLQTVLTRFSAQSGIYLAGSLDLAKGKSSPGLKGTFSAQEGLARLLAGTGLETSRTENGQYLLRASPAVNGASTLPTVTVTAETIDPAKQLNPPTTIGSKVPLTQREIAQSVTVITQEQIKQQNLQTLDQVLRYTPGIDVLNSDGQRFQYYSRGFPITSFQQDGAPIFVNPNMSGTASTSAPSLAMYDRVEVLRGADGLFNGFGSPGGTINLVRKRPQREFSASGEVSGGTLSDRGSQLDVGGPLNEAGTLRGRVVGSYEDQDLTQDSTWRKDRLFYGTLEADLSPDTLLRVGASYSYMKQKNTWTGSPTYADGSFTNRSKYFGAPWNRESALSSDAFLQLEQKLGAGWRIQTTADYMHNRYRVFDGEFEAPLDAGGNGTFGTTNKMSYEDNQSYDINASGPFSLLGRTHQITVGASWLRMKNHQTTWYGTENRWNEVDINASDVGSYAEPVFSGDPATTDKTVETTTKYGIYTNARFSLADPLTLVAGASLNWWNDVNNHDPVYNPFSSSSTNDSYNHKITPYAALIYDLNDTYSVYTSYSRIFEPQSARTAGGNIIPPIVGEQYEAGIKGAYLDGKLNASLAIFQLNQKNRATADTRYPLDSFYVAQGKARSQGFETQISGELTPDWTIQAGYTYTNTKTLDDSSDWTASSFTQVAPKHVFRAWTNYHLPGEWSKWQLGAGFTASSRTWNEEDGMATVYQGGYSTVDGRISYQINKKTSLALNITNIFDRHYVTSFGGNQQIYWGTPRKAILTLRFAY